MKKNNIKTVKSGSLEKGSGMVEILIAASLMGVILIAIINVYSSLTALSLQNTEKIQSTFLLEEGVEAVRVMRDTSWTTISGYPTGTTMYLRFQSGAWVATMTPQVVDDFYRTITFNKPGRDASFNLMPLGGTDDPNTRRITISVSWEGKGGTTTKSVETYVFNTFGN